MTLLKSIRNAALFTSCMAVLGGALPARSYAETIVFQFQTTIDARRAGGAANTSLVVTYAFDSQLPNTVATDPTHGKYYPIVMTIQVADEIVTATGPANQINIGNDEGTIDDDSYDVRIFNDTGTDVTGTLFGMQVSFFRFVLSDDKALMFNSTDLPLSPVFALLADFQQTELDLFDPVTGNIVQLSVEAAYNTPAKELTQFSLTLSYDPIFELIVDVVKLELPEPLENSLLQKLHAALGSVASAQPNDAAAIGQLQAFIDQIEAQSGKSLSPQEADDLAGVAQLVILGLLASG